jgi:hypothetical protein
LPCDLIAIDIFSSHLASNFWMEQRVSWLKKRGQKAMVHGYGSTSKGIMVQISHVDFT